MTTINIPDWLVYVLVPLLLVCEIMELIELIKRRSRK